MSRPERSSITYVLAALTVGLGVALIVRTLTAGGGPIATGTLLGIAFVLVGAGRFYLASRGPT